MIEMIFLLNHMMIKEIFKVIINQENPEDTSFFEETASELYVMTFFPAIQNFICMNRAKNPNLSDGKHFILKLGKIVDMLHSFSCCHFPFRAPSGEFVFQ
jgi:hypothetical protein